MAGTSSGDLLEFAVNCVYGDLMAEDSILSVKDTALLEFACCYAGWIRGVNSSASSGLGEFACGVAHNSA